MSADRKPEKRGRLGMSYPIFHDVIPGGIFFCGQIGAQGKLKRRKIPLPGIF